MTAHPGQHFDRHL